MFRRGTAITFLDFVYMGPMCRNVLKTGSDFDANIQDGGSNMIHIYRFKNKLYISQ